MGSCQQLLCSLLVPESTCFCGKDSLLTVRSKYHSHSLQHGPNSSQRSYFVWEETYKESKNPSPFRGLKNSLLELKTSSVQDLMCSSSSLQHPKGSHCSLPSTCLPIERQYLSSCTGDHLFHLYETMYVKLWMLQDLDFISLKRHLRSNVELCIILFLFWILIFYFISKKNHFWTRVYHSIIIH